MRAAGEPGPHWIDFGALEPQRSPTSTSSSPRSPGSPVSRMKFTVTKGAANPRTEDGVARESQADDRRELTTPSRRRTSHQTRRRPPRSRPRGRVRSLEDDDQGRRPHAQRAGRPSSGRRSSAIESTARARVGASCLCPSGRPTAAADGTLSSQVTVPDGLGRLARRAAHAGGQGDGPGAVLREAQLHQGAPKVVKAGQPFIVELKGVGWTQLDNTNGGHV